MSLLRKLILARPAFATHVLIFAPLLLPAYTLSARAQQPPQQAATPQFKIGGAVSTPLTITGADLKAMPRKTVKVLNAHNQKTEVYEGVPLAALLQKAGVPQGKALRGALMATYVLVEASDGYRVAFSLAELDSGIIDSDVLVADTLDGAPVGQDEGPFKLVAPHEKRPARWVRMVRSITVVKPN
jgi:DMSO/TMAO reductase YedYZ molybdopterin-dependent catalytic subunit